MRVACPGILAHLVLAAVALAAAPGVGEASGPPQPIPFSHRVHAGVNQIGCLLCHAYALHSPTAGIPSMARCVGCHKMIDRDKPAVRQVLQTADEGKVIRWVRVYRVPDHVFFTHERHLAASLACQRCHGPVETMDVVRLAQPLLMGWCVDCHRARKAPTDCLMCHK